MLQFSGEVDNYQVHMVRNHKSHGPIQAGERRLFLLHLKPGQRANNIVTVHLHYSDNWAADYMGEKASANHIVVVLPFDDFDDHYHLLQTESPVYASWSYSENPREPDAIGRFSLSTSAEPVGEGFVDT